MKKRLGEILLERQLVTTDQLNVALAHQRQWSMRLGAALVAKGMVTEGQLTSVLSESLGIPMVDLSKIVVDPKALALVPSDVCEQHDLFPISVKQQKGRPILLVAMADPLNFAAIDELTFSTGSKVQPAIAQLSSVSAAIRLHYYGQTTVTIPPLEAQGTPLTRAGVPTGAAASPARQPGPPEALGRAAAAPVQVAAPRSAPNGLPAATPAAPPPRLAPVPAAATVPIAAAAPGGSVTLPMAAAAPGGSVTLPMAATPAPAVTLQMGVPSATPGSAPPTSATPAIAASAAALGKLPPAHAAASLTIPFGVQPAAAPPSGAATAAQWLAGRPVDPFAAAADASTADRDDDGLPLVELYSDEATGTFSVPVSKGGAAAAGALDPAQLSMLLHMDDASSSIEEKFWALMRVLANRGLITREEFLAELNNRR